MGKPLRVLIYGDTLVLGCLRASLAAHDDVRAIDLDLSLPNAEELAALQPDVIIFDLATHLPAELCVLASQLREVRLVGVDPSANRVTVWWQQQFSELSTRDLAAAIGGQVLGPVCQACKEAR